PALQEDRLPVGWTASPAGRAVRDVVQRAELLYLTPPGGAGVVAAVVDLRFSDVLVRAVNLQQRLKVSFSLGEECWWLWLNNAPTPASWAEARVPVPRPRPCP